VEDYFRQRDDGVSLGARRRTVEINSSLAEQRARPLLDLFYARSGRETLAGLRVVDLGCGFGALSLYFAAVGAEVTGLDPIGSRMKVGRTVAREYGLPVRFVRARMQEMDLPADRFDLAIQNNSLCYVLDRAQRAEILDRTHRMLRPGGWLVIRNPNRLHPRDQFTGLPLLHLLPPALATRLARALGRKRSTVRVLSPRAAERELEASGFSAVASSRSPGSPWPAQLSRFARYQLVSGRRPE
jgi:2-polyprenyl-3-methyl-5-hydroxy-6-metoxy-1,4-benzoquinol methylase